MAARLPTAERQVKQQRAWLLRQQFRTQEQIAEELGVTQQAVCGMLQREGKRQAEVFQAQALEIKAAQTAQLDQIATEAYQAWLRSLEDAEESRTKAVRGAEPEKAKPLPNLGTHRGDDDDPVDFSDTDFEPPLVDMEVVSTRKGQSGNPALLAQAREALADIRQIWGIDAPQKQDVTSGGEPFKVYVNVSPDDL